MTLLHSFRRHALLVCQVFYYFGTSFELQHWEGIPPGSDCFRPYSTVIKTGVINAQDSQKFLEFIQASGLSLAFDCMGRIKKICSSSGNSFDSLIHLLPLFSFRSRCHSLRRSLGFGRRTDSTWFE